MGDLNLSSIDWFQFLSDIPKEYSKGFGHLATSGSGQVGYKPTHKLGNTLDVVFAKSDLFTSVDVYR